MVTAPESNVASETSDARNSDGGHMMATGRRIHDLMVYVIRAAIHVHNLGITDTLGPYPQCQPDWTHIKCVCSAIVQHLAHARIATFARDFAAFPLGKRRTDWKEVFVQMGTHLFEM